MYPMYGWTDSYPHLRNQMVYAPYHTQSLEAAPPHMKMDPARPAMFEPWPHSGSYGYSCTTDCHGCCNHNYFPGHYCFRPTYPHFSPPPPPHSYHGSYPAIFGGYPGYQIPPPHFSVEQPRYEYDKSFPRDQHCCGCPNHSCKREFNENVKIEERKAEIEKKSNDSLVPSHLRNSPFPFVMIPPGYLMDTEGSKSGKSEGKEDNKINHETECVKSSKSLNTSGSLHEKATRSQQDIQSQFPFPLFWLPHKPEEVEKDDFKGMNSGQEADIAPYEENDEVKIPLTATGPKMIGNGATQKATPVKKMEQVEEKQRDEEKKIKAIPVVQADDHQEKGCGENGAKIRASSSKSSKLPPVCLRVDPPSKSKKVNGSSRSPSPPADKGRSRQSSNENSKSLGQNEQSQKQVDKSKEIESREKNIQMVEGISEGKREAQTNNHVSPSHEDPSRKSRVEGVNDVLNQDVGEATEGEEARLEGQLANKEEANKAKKKMLSDAEAAASIQSVYRGYEVRKSEPLKKLRQITEIIQKMIEVKSRISILDSCSDVEIDEKQLVAIGETIMGLLLKLDTIQGLHSSVRDVRKSVAKELVSLQEKLDSLTTRKAYAPIVPPSSETPEGPTAITADNVGVESNQNAAEVVLGSTQGNGIDTDVQSGNNHVENGISGHEHVEKSELIAAKEPGNNTSKLGPVSNVGPRRPDSDGEMELEDQKDQVVNNGDRQITTENEEGLELEGAGVTEVEGVDSSSLVELSGKVGEVAQPINLPHGILETTETTGDVGLRDDPVVEDIKVDSAAGNRNLDVDQLEQVETTETTGDVGLRDDPVVEDIKVDSAAGNRNLDVDQLENVDGNEEKNKNFAQESRLEPEEMHDDEAHEKDLSYTEKYEVVSEIEGRDFSSKEDNEVQTENVLTTSAQEKEPADNDEDLKEAKITLEWVPPATEDITNIDGNDDKAPTLQEEQSEKELPMQNDTVDQPRENLSQVTIGSESPGKAEMEKGGEMVMEENKRLKEMMEKLIEAGNEQLATITKLSGKVKDLEKKLSKNKKLKTKKKTKGKRQDMVLAKAC